MSYVATSYLFRKTSADTITHCVSYSVANVGEADAVVNGSYLKPSESVSYIAPGGQHFENINFDGTGTELLVSFVLNH